MGFTCIVGIGVGFGSIFEGFMTISFESIDNGSHGFEMDHSP